MRGPGRLRSVVVAAASATGLVAGAGLGSPLASAVPARRVPPTAEISIKPAHGAFTVRLVAASAGLSSPAVTWSWTFGDATSTTTSSAAVVHQYPGLGTYAPSVTETDSGGQMATASGTLEVTDCQIGTGQCTEALPPSGTILQFQVSGPQRPTAPGTVDLFTGPWKVPTCEPQVSPAVAFTDTGFTGALTVTLQYLTAYPNQAPTTCFSSTVPFLDSSNQTVRNGALPACNPFGPVPPCVQSVSMNGLQVTKVVLVPPNDPKVGAA